MVSKMEQRKMRNRMYQALQPPKENLMSKERVNELVENYMNKTTENYDLETLIPVSMLRLKQTSSLALSCPCPLPPVPCPLSLSLPLPLTGKKLMAWIETDYKYH